MLIVNVTLLQGCIRATSADDLALTGLEDRGDWPPSPARLLAAFVAADGTRDRCRVTTGEELLLIERAGPPRILASAGAKVLSSAQNPRYVVRNARDDGNVQEYAARKPTLVRPGTRMFPADPRVVYIWDDVVASDAEMGALARRAARIGYLGCADSPAHVSVSSHLSADTAGLAEWRPDDSGDCDIPVPFPGLLDVLDAAYDAFSAGQPIRRSWYRTELARYRGPASVRPTAPSSAPSVVWLRFERAIAGRRALATAEALKAAVLRLYQDSLPHGAGEVPGVLHGHGFTGSGYQLAQWVPLPDVGFPYSRGSLHGAAIVLPAGTARDVVENVRGAVWRLRRLLLPGGEEVVVRPGGDEERPRAASARRWSRRATRWVAAFPIVQERRRRGGPTLGDAALWCRHAALPAPVAARFSAVPLLPGSPALQPHEVFRSRRADPRPYVWAELTFAEPVAGPVVIGRSRQYGMGLMLPGDER